MGTTTRLTKVVDSATYVASTEGTCEESIVTFYEGFHAAATLLGTHAIVKNETGKDAELPIGCVTVDAGNSQVRVFFNELETSASCSTSARCVCPSEVTKFGQSKGALLYTP